jgi:peptidoglycan/xylan/chitin deacetylase (PgdA/CDA1 family)
MPLFYILFHFLLPFSGFEKTSLTKLKPIQESVSDSLVRHIYLSFDDGPLNGTANCINICSHEKVAATFFQIGMHQSRSSFGKKLYSQILQNPSLFDLSNHSFSHANGKYLPYYHHPDTALEDFQKAKNILHPKNNLVRLPGNNAWSTKNEFRASGLVKPLVLKLDSVGYNVMGWDLEWHFNKKGKPIQTPEEMASRVDTLLFYNKTKTPKHLVILMHDHMFASSADSAKLARFVILLKKNPAYQFNKLTSYPGLK